MERNTFRELLNEGSLSEVDLLHPDFEADDVFYDGHIFGAPPFPLIPPPPPEIAVAMGNPWADEEHHLNDTMDGWVDFDDNTLGGDDQLGEAQPPENSHDAEF